MTRTNKAYYEKVYQELEKKGYRVIGERCLGYSRPHSPLDAVVMKGKDFILTEIKADKEVKDFWTMADFDYKELSKTNSDRPYLDYFKEIKEMVDGGKVSRQVAAHMYFLEKTKWKSLDFYAGKWWIKGEEYDLGDKNLKAGYSVPAFECESVERALKARGSGYDKVALSGDILYHFEFLR